MYNIIEEYTDLKNEGNDGDVYVYDNQINNLFPPYSDRYLVNGQSSDNIDYIGTNDGLPSIHISNFSFDQQTNSIWLSTYDGAISLNLLDYRNFINLIFTNISCMMLNKLI